MNGGTAAARDRVAPDCRLVPAALAVWLAGLLGLQLVWWLAVTCGLIAAVLGSILFVSRRGPNATGASLLLAGLLAAGILGVQLYSAEHDPLRERAERGGVIDAEVTLTDRPRPVRTAGYANRQGTDARVVLTATVDEANVEGTPAGSSGRITLITPVEGWQQLLPGQQLRMSGRLTPAPDGELTVATVRVDAADSGQQESSAVPAEVTHPPWWQSMGAALREGLRAATAVLPEDEAGLVPGLVLGDTSAMPQRLIDEFRAAGMSHLVAVSGLHVGIICGAVLLLLRIVRAGPRLSAVTAGVVLIGYMITVGYAPSVLRAGVMGGVGLLALFLGRQRSAMPALAFAVSLLVLYDPQMAVRFGFAMSVAATAALVLLAPVFSDALQRRRVPQAPAVALVIPLVGFLATAPIIAGMAGRVSLVTVLANLLATPVVAVTTVLGALAAVAAGFAPWLAEVFLRLAWLELSWLVSVARTAANVPGGVIEWPDGWSGGILAALVLGAIVLAFQRRVFRRVVAVCLAAVLVAYVTVRLLTPSWPPDGWAFVACDVGQGDGLVLATGEPREAVVIDVGSELGGMSACLDRLGVERIPLLVLTHLHADHIGGLSSTLSERHVDGVAVGPGRTPRWAWDEVVETTARHEVPLFEVAAGDELAWSELRLRVIGPRYVPAEQDSEPTGTQVNDLSLVLTADTPVGRALLTGDVELAAQGDLLASDATLRSDVLKVPHHGSSYALPEFLEAAAPEVAVISSGEGNNYNHPDPDIVDRLAESGASIARTDTDGDIALIPAEQATEIVRRGE